MKEHSSASTNTQRPAGPLRPESAAGKAALLGLLTALAVIMGYIEARIPLPLPVPGIKLGLCNIVIVYVLYRYGFRYALAVSCIRIVVIGLLFGSPVSMLYSFGGALLSIGGMALLMKAGKFSVIGVSAAGGALHSAGQIAVAAFLTGGTGIFRYLPVLLLAGEFCGAVIGIVDALILKRLRSYRNEGVI